MFAGSSMAIVSCGDKSSKKENAPPPQGKTDSAVNSDLFGSWGTFSATLADDKTGARLGMSEISFRIADGKISISNTCTLNGGLVIGPVEVLSEANISIDTIEILEDKTASLKGEKSGMKGECNASLAKGKMTYKLEGDSLSFQAEGEDKPLILKKI
jgi:hypothetical protein